MSVDVRAEAGRLIGRVVADGRSLSGLMPQSLDSIEDARQRALLQELVYGSLRWFFRLDALLHRLLKKPLKKKDADLHGLLLAGLYQLDRLDMPERVAVHETVQAVHALGKDWASGLVNAVLRNFQRQGSALEKAIGNDVQARTAHPGWLIRRLKKDWPEHWEAVLAANNERPPFSLRCSARQGSREDCLDRLAAASIEAQPLRHVLHGVRLERPVPVSALPGFSVGALSVQDGAAQLAAELLGAGPGDRVLDACAAPGGKTLHILESCAELAGVTAIDSDAGRARRIRENLDRAGLDADVLVGDAADPTAWWDGVPYQRILLDAPCSATGVIRRHPDIKLLRKAKDIAALAETQLGLLQALWPLLSQDGILLYCTCSVLLEENAATVGRFLAGRQDAVERPVEAAWGHACSHGRQLLPGEDEMDGFYYACLQKTC